MTVWLIFIRVDPLYYTKEPYTATGLSIIKLICSFCIKNYFKQKESWTVWQTDSHLDRIKVWIKGGGLNLLTSFLGSCGSVHANIQSMDGSLKDLWFSPAYAAVTFFLTSLSESDKQVFLYRLLIFQSSRLKHLFPVKDLTNQWHLRRNRW